MSLDKLQRKFCPICGEDIIFKVSVPGRYFYINESGELEEDKNNSLIADSGFSYFCSGDAEHNIDDAYKMKLQFLDDWVEDIMDEIYSKMYYY